MSELNGYSLMRDLFDFAFENPEKISPNHIAMFAFIVEHCNRLGWKKKFGLPTEMTKDAIGIRNYKTFANTFHDLIEWGFIDLVEKSKNQYSANIIALVKNTKAHTKALTKASLKHSAKHIPKQVQSIVGIDKPINNETIKTIKPYKGKKPPPTFDENFILFKEHYKAVWDKLNKTYIDESAKETPDSNLIYQLKKAHSDIKQLVEFVEDNEMTFVAGMSGQMTVNHFLTSELMRNIEEVKTLLLGVEESDALKKKNDPYLYRTILNWYRKDRR